MWYIGNVLTTVVYIFFGVSSEKNVNTVIIIALHKSRLMPVFSPQQSPVSLQLLNSIYYWNLTDKRNANLRPEDCLHWSSFSLSLESHKAIKHCSNLSAVHSRESHSHNKYFTALNHQVKTQASTPTRGWNGQGKVVSLFTFHLMPEDRAWLFSFCFCLQD